MTTPRQNQNQNNKYRNDNDQYLGSSITTIIVSVVVAGLIFVASNAFLQKGNDATVTVKLENLSGQIADLKGAIIALSVNTIKRDEFVGLEMRTRELESRVYKK